MQLRNSVRDIYVFSSRAVSNAINTNPFARRSSNDKRIILATIDLSPRKKDQGSGSTVGISMSPAVRSPSPIVAMPRPAAIAQEQEHGILKERPPRQAQTLHSPPAGAKKKAGGGSRRGRAAKQKKSMNSQTVPIGAGQIQKSTLKNNKSLEDLNVELTYSMADLGSRIAVYR